MAVNIKDYYIYSYNPLIIDKDLPSKLSKQGFKIEKDGTVIFPTNYYPQNIYVNLNKLNGDVTTCRYVDTTGEVIKLFNCWYSANISYRYDKYSYEKTPLLYTHKNLPSTRVYRHFLEYKFTDLTSWLNFPFKPELQIITNPSDTMVARLEQLKNLMNDLLLWTNVTIEDYKSHIEKLLETSFYAKYETNEYGDEKTSYSFPNWESFMLFETYEDRRKGLKINVCSTCHERIYITGNSHTDRLQHTKEEKPDCYRIYERTRKNIAK